MSSKLAQLLEQVAKSKATNVEKMSDLSRLDESLLSSVAGGAAGPKLGAGAECNTEGEGEGEYPTPYVKYWQDL